MEEESTVEYKTEIAEKRPQVIWSYDVAERKDGGNGNYLLLALSGKNKGPSFQEILPPKPPQEVHPQKPRDS